MKKLLFALTLVCSVHLVSGQQIDLIKLDQLYERVRHGQDTVFVLNFWATWCSPCVQELPHFEKLAEQYKDQKLRVLLICLDFKSKAKTAVVPFVAKNKIQSQVFILDEPDQQAFINRVDSTWSGALPATLFIKNQTRKFFEQEFTFPALEEMFQKIK